MIISPLTRIINEEKLIAQGAARTRTETFVPIADAELPTANMGCARTAEYYRFAGLPHKTPQKMRHGHVRYALERIKTMAEYKALSLNIMHDDIRTRDIFHAPLEDAVQELIGILSHRQAG